MASASAGAIEKNGASKDPIFSFRKCPPRIGNYIVISKGSETKRLQVYSSIIQRRVFSDLDEETHSNSFDPEENPSLHFFLA